MKGEKEGKKIQNSREEVMSPWEGASSRKVREDKWSLVRSLKKDDHHQEENRTSNSQRGDHLLYTEVDSITSGLSFSLCFIWLKNTTATGVFSSN